MNELIRDYKKYKKAGYTIMMSYAKNRLLRFYNYDVEVTG